MENENVHLLEHRLSELEKRVGNMEKNMSDNNKELIIIKNSISSIDKSLTIINKEQECLSELPYVIREQGFKLDSIIDNMHNHKLTLDAHVKEDKETRVAVDERLDELESKDGKLALSVVKVIVGAIGMAILGGIITLVAMELGLK